MFNHGIEDLLARLPQLSDLSSVDIRRLLSRAFLDLVAARELGGVGERALEHAATLRRLATALELHVSVGLGVHAEDARACAFVAAEALEIVRDLEAVESESASGVVGELPPIQYTSAEAGALFLIAGFDANAAVAARTLRMTAIRDAGSPAAEAAARAVQSIRALLELRAPPRQPFPQAIRTLPLGDRIRWEVWRRIARSLDAHLAALTNRAERPAVSASTSLSNLAETLFQTSGHADLAHLAWLLAIACDETARRALIFIPSPSDESAIWNAYVHRRVTTRPLLWPAAYEYASAALPGPTKHAVVTVPTGAGKSSVAELAIAQALDHGWVLYLAPTNALVAQIMRDLRGILQDAEEVAVRGFLGGAEYTELPGETVEDVMDGQVLVMTPEKCSLALRQAHEVFAGLSLVVMDECHLLADPGSRGVVAELVLAELLHRAPTTSVLLLSALVANGDELASWLEATTGREALPVSNPWRPTRTLRGLLGVDPDRATPPYREARASLAALATRRNWGFEAPSALLASLLGPWLTLDPQNYAVVPSDLTLPLNLRRRNDGSIELQRTGYVNEAAARLTRLLAESGQRVLTFLPANRHYSFSVARDLPDLEPQPIRNARLAEINALLDLADFELGVESVLRGLIHRGIAVHTSAMLRDEQRASEMAFSDGQARALFATGTLAQGLNLPANAVVIAGTRVGDDRQLREDLRDERARAQLLNAVGRAGRAYVAERAVAIVIPDHWVSVRAGRSPSRARREAEFLAFEDASTEVRSHVEGLITTALEEPDVQIGHLTTEEQVAFGLLGAEDDAEQAAIVRRSFGAFRAGLSDADSVTVARTLRSAGQAFLDEVDAPDWIAIASHASGLSLPLAAALYRRLDDAGASEAPDTVAGWRDVLIRCIATVRPELLARALPERPFTGTAMERLVQPYGRRDRSWRAATQVLDVALQSWMAGGSHSDMAGQILGSGARGDPRRGSGNPLPKVITLTDHGFGFGISRLAGGLAAIVAIHDEGPDDLPLAPTDESRLALDILPLGVRFGCDNVANLAWYRWGFRRRRIAHLLARLLPPPADLSDEDLAAWVAARRAELVSGDLELEVEGDEARTLRALRTASSAS